MSDWTSLSKLLSSLQTRGVVPADGVHLQTGPAVCVNRVSGQRCVRSVTPHTCPAFQVLPHVLGPWVPVPG